MATRTGVLTALVLATLIVTVALVVAKHGPPAIASKAVGTWEEVGVAHPQRMTIEKTGVEDYAVKYPVAEAGSYADIATLEDDHLQVWGENAISDPRYEIRYDEDRDRLAADRDGATVNLRRVR